ncbi:MAG: GTP-binding protein [Chloroflexota bacterium]
MTANKSTLFPVTILTGFLGAGKTTLLNRLLNADHGLRLGVLVNDFGAINIDARLVDVLEADSVSLTNGCVCCSMRGDLTLSTIRMLDRPIPPEHLIVEASGIADPARVAGAFRVSSLRDRTRLDGIVTLVDAENARNPRLDRQLVEDQIRTADLVILNKVDLVEAPTRVDLGDWIRTLAPWARVLEARDANVPVELVLGIDRASSDVVGSSRSHDVPFGTWSYSTLRPFAYRKIREALESLPVSVYRGKGIVILADAPNLRFVTQLVGRRVSIDVAGPWGSEAPRTDLVFIGTSDAMSADDLAIRLDACTTDSIVLMSRHNLRAVKETREEKIK